MAKHFCQSHVLIALLAIATPALHAQNPQLFLGDWVGEIRVGGAPTFIHARFSKDSIGPAVSLDMPTTQTWGVAARLSVGAGDNFGFDFPFGRDTAHFDGTTTAISVDGRVHLGKTAGTLRLLHRLAYDSAFVRSLAGNYELAPDHIISMGPLDEAGGWLSFFDNKTLRGGILYALTDSTFFSGPSYGIDYPIAIRASLHRDAAGGIDALDWSGRREAGSGRREALSKGLARRLDDFTVEKDVSFMNGDVRLVGDLTLPKTPGPHPAVVLIHGCCGSKPTRDFGYWSAYLAHHGIAVLAYDRRGAGASGGDFNSATYEDVAGDVVAGFDMLTRRPDIDPKRIGVFGMSNGGYVAPLAVVRSGGRIAFVVVRSGSARRVGDNIDYEVGNDLRSHGFDSSVVRRGVELRRRVTDFVIDRPVISAAAWDSLRAEVRSVRSEPWFQWARTIWVLYVSPADSGGANYINSLRRSWSYDPIPFWRQVKAPVYIMLGGLDRSVPTAETAPAFRKVFKESHNPDATVRVFPQGNHGLLAARTGFDSEARFLAYYLPGFQSSVASWIRKRVALAGEVSTAK
ncbi:MAG TPA: alpha/beta fold hydrolase [Gemmatimonadaceae bacterium]|nr:alpha/beta fold hydrolase [Gemmatimonadaceae bacterium]